MSLSTPPYYNSPKEFKDLPAPNQRIHVEKQGRQWKALAMGKVVAFDLTKRAKWVRHNQPQKRNKLT